MPVTAGLGGAGGPSGLMLTPTAYPLPRGLAGLGVSYFEQSLAAPGGGFGAGRLRLPGAGFAYGVTDRFQAGLSLLGVSGRTSGIQWGVSGKYCLLEEGKHSPATVAAGAAFIGGEFPLDRSVYLVASRRVTPRASPYLTHLHVGVAYDHGDFRSASERFLPFGGLDVQLLRPLKLTADVRGESIEQRHPATAFGLHYAAPGGWGVSVGAINIGASGSHEPYVAVGYSFHMSRRYTPTPTETPAAKTHPKR